MTPARAPAKRGCPLPHRRWPPRTPRSASGEARGLRYSVGVCLIRPCSATLWASPRCDRGCPRGPGGRCGSGHPLLQGAAWGQPWAAFCGRAGRCGPGPGPVRPGPGGPPAGTIVLAGIAVHALAQTVLMCLKLTADPERELASIEYWIMGSLNGVTSDAMGGSLALCAVSVGVAVPAPPADPPAGSGGRGRARMLGVQGGPGCGWPSCWQPPWRWPVWSASPG